LWIQHGYGKGQKIADVTSAGPTGGVILSPADEDRATLSATADDARSRGLAVVMDPQTYVWGIPEGAARNHDDNGLAFPELHWSMAPDQIDRVIASVLEANRRIATDFVLSPTCLQRGFGDVWTPLSIQLARATLARSTNPVYVSIVLDDTALNEWKAIDEWLDIVTTFEAAGFYVVVSRGRENYPQPWEPARLANLLRLMHRLSTVNEFPVLVGYADLDGLAAIAAGVSDVASGWYFSLRSFSESKWKPSTGGRAAKPRVTSAPLITPMLLEEASVVARSRFGTRAFPEADLRARIGSNPESWGLSDAWMQHLTTLQQLVAEVEGVPTGQKVEWLLERLRAGWSGLGEISDSGTILSPHYRNYLESLGRGLRDFAEAEGL
jgi:hypothetical protein